MKESPNVFSKSGLMRFTKSGPHGPATLIGVKGLRFETVLNRTPAHGGYFCLISSLVGGAGSPHGSTRIRCLTLDG